MWQYARHALTNAEVLCQASFREPVCFDCELCYSEHKPILDRVKVRKRSHGSPRVASVAAPRRCQSQSGSQTGRVS